LRTTRGDRTVVSPTVHEIRNAIRGATGRFEREIEATFTKEELRAICAALEVGIDGGERPSTTWMRRQIRARVGVAASPGGAAETTFRKAELRAIADALGVSSGS
jgi:hypothetical protein